MGKLFSSLNKLNKFFKKGSISERDNKSNGKIDKKKRNGKGGKKKQAGKDAPPQSN